MKKITLLIALLITSIGFSQDLLLGMETGETGGLGDPFGGSSPVLEAGTGTNTSRVLKIVGNTATDVWQGVNLNLTSSVQLTTTKTMTMDVKSSTPITFLVKVKDGSTASTEAAAAVTHNGDGTWQTLSFTFNTALDGKAATANDVYRTFVIHTYWAPGATTFGTVTRSARTFYVDNIKGIKVVTAPAFAPPAAPTPTTPNAQVFSLFSDTAEFTNNWARDYFFGGASRPNLATTGTNIAYKVNFASEGYGEGLEPANPRKDVSSYGFLNFDYYVQSGAANAGPAGHQFYFELIHRIGENNTESFYGFGPAISSTGGPSQHVKQVMVFDSWQTVSIPLSSFVGFSPANFFQWKIGSNSVEYTKVGFFDNIYFSVNNPALGTSKFETATVKMYPNPAKNSVTIDANGSIERVAIYSILGQEVMSKSPKSNSTTIQTSALQKGTYIVRSTVDGKTSTSKLVKE